jgi:hypothetical protein
VAILVSFHSLCQPADKIKSAAKLPTKILYLQGQALRVASFIFEVFIFWGKNKRPPALHLKFYPVTGC